jgi:hypothetical protein
MTVETTDDNSMCETRIRTRTGSTKEIADSITGATTTQAGEPPHILKSTPTIRQVGCHHRATTDEPTSSYHNQPGVMYSIDA